MSTPIIYCRIVKACSDEEAYQELLKDMKYNITQFAWSQMPCPCNPKHTITEQQLEKLNARLQKDLYSKECLKNNQEN
jgi:hypothetical protein